jgi:hypothetical protein
MQEHHPKCELSRRELALFAVVMTLVVVFALLGPVATVHLL